MDESNPPMLSIIIPVYNEQDTIEELFRQVLEVQLAGIEKEVILVDDGSTDGTVEWLREFQKKPEIKRNLAWAAQCGNNGVRGNVRILCQEQNQGKGTALLRGFREAKGDVILVQDADLEYDPRDYALLLQPILENEVDVVYGSRFLSHETPAWTMFGYLGSKFITALSNMFTGLSSSDVWTGYKVFKRSVIQQMTLNEPGFELELELTSKIAQGKWRIREVPISYFPRSRAEGKKITWKDGVKAIRIMLRYRHHQGPNRQEGYKNFQRSKTPNPTD